MFDKVLLNLTGPDPRLWLHLNRLHNISNTWDEIIRSPLPNLMFPLFCWGSWTRIVLFPRQGTILILNESDTFSVFWSCCAFGIVLPWLLNTAASFLQHGCSLWSHCSRCYFQDDFPSWLTAVSPGLYSALDCDLLSLVISAVGSVVTEQQAVSQRHPQNAYTCRTFPGENLTYLLLFLAKLLVR